MRLLLLAKWAFIPSWNLNCKLLCSYATDLYVHLRRKCKQNKRQSIHFSCKKREGMLYSIKRKGRIAVLKKISFFLKFKTHDRKIAHVTHEGIEKDLDLRRLKWWLININCFAVFFSQPVLRSFGRDQNYNALRPVVRFGTRRKHITLFWSISSFLASQNETRVRKSTFVSHVKFI